MPEFEWDINVENLKNGIVAVDKKAQAAVEMYAKNQAKRLESYAKQKAPWTDRTGDARQRLKYNSEINENGLTISIFHQMEYGIYLELCNNEKYAILKNSRDAMLPEFLDAVKHIRL